MSTLPGWEIHVPGSADELELALHAAHRSASSTYVRMSVEANTASYGGRPGTVSTIRTGSPGSQTVLAVGPVADAVVAATCDLDVTVLYTMTPVPLDRTGLRAAVTGHEIIVVEPYLVGTSTHAVMSAFADRPMIVRSHGVERAELRKYGTVAQHRAAHRLDAAGIRSVIDAGRARRIA